MTEGQNEEKVYIFLDFSDCKDVYKQPVPGSKILLKGLDTNRPEVCLENGHILTGGYKDTLGSQMFLEESGSGQRADDSKLQGDYPQVIGISDKTIIFKKILEKKSSTKKVVDPDPAPAEAVSNQAPAASDMQTAQKP